MHKITIDAKNARYISDIPEFKNELPKGILNKKRADVGGTFAALNYPTNYIIIVPSLSLIDSIIADKNKSYNIFDVKGGTKKEDLLIYLATNEIHKIVVTFDSFAKLVNWTIKEDIDILNYKVLVDEFHVILNSYGFRKTAIDSLGRVLKDFCHVTYMSATPIDDSFLIAVLNNQPYTEIKWNHINKVSINRFETHNTLLTTMTLIEKYLSEKGLIFTQFNGSTERVEELYIFINSVTDIAKIINSFRLKKDLVKIVCTDNSINRKNLKNVNAEISNISDPNKKINFFTSRAFEGCNLFTNNGLVIAVSDSHKKHTLIDVKTSLVQIHGRLRYNEEYQNIFRHLIIHVYSTINSLHPDRNQEKFKKEAIAKIITKQSDSKNVISTYNNLSKKEKVTYRKQIEKEPFYTEYDEINDIYEVSNFMIAFDTYQTKLIYHVYSNGLSIQKAYSTDHFQINKREENVCINNNIEIKIALTAGFKELLQDYIILKENNKGSIEILKYESEYPIFKKAYNEMGVSRIRSFQYSKTDIKRYLDVYSSQTIDNIMYELFESKDDGIFISNSDLKKQIIAKYEELNIEIRNIGITNTKIIEKCTNYEFDSKQRRIDGKPIKGYVIKKVEFNILTVFAHYESPNLQLEEELEEKYEESLEI